jgi:para-nitrobenzyl esterase
MNKHNARCFHVAAILFLAASSFMALPAAAQRKLGPIQIEGGSISGTPGWAWGVREYRGIPYAAPPVGDLRWRPPQPVIPWRGTIAADHFSPRCMQAGGGPVAQVGGLWNDPGTNQTSEDCLYLNVWTPSTSPDDKLPVIVWFHGGGLVSGQASDAVFDGSMLAKKGAVVVTVNYRLNIFGFFSHPALTAESEHHSSGNYGPLDQLAALRWVKNNIAQFGGDPNLVTIAGQSGGSRSISFHMASPLAKGLFQRAIAQSHASFSQMPTLAEAEAVGVRFAEKIGVTSIKDLRAMPPKDLEASLEQMDPYPGEPSAVVDGWYLPADLHTIFAAGKQNDVPLLTGGTNDERTAVGPLLSFPRGLWLQSVRGPRAATLDDYRNLAHTIFGDLGETFLKAYPAKSDEDVAQALHDFGRDTVLAYHRTWVQIQAKTGKAPPYLYLFSQAPPVPTAAGSMPAVQGAVHGGEIIYTFNNLRTRDVPWTDTDRKVADIVSSYWVNFAKTGDPNGAGLPQWSPYDPASDQLMNITGDPHMQAAPSRNASARQARKNNRRPPKLRPPRVRKA